VHGEAASGKRQVRRVDPAGRPWDSSAPPFRMPNYSPAPPTAPAKNPWPRVVTFLGLLALLLGAGLWTLHRLTGIPGAALGQGVALVKEMGGQAATVARAFREGTVREEFLSHTAALAGTSRFQFATLSQGETFQRSEADNIAWGLIALPKVVVQAQAPVEYTYFLDLQAPWEFRQDGKTITVLAPSISANAPALDVSALTFYTLEGSVWRDENAVRERLRESLTATLRKRARENGKLVREIGRQKVAEFVEQWLGEKFGDGRDYRVKVIFPDEVPVPPAEKPAPRTVE